MQLMHVTAFCTGAGAEEVTHANGTPNPLIPSDNHLWDNEAASPYHNDSQTGIGQPASPPSPDAQVRQPLVSGRATPQSVTVQI